MTWTVNVTDVNSVKNWYTAQKNNIRDGDDIVVSLLFTKSNIGSTSTFQNLFRLESVGYLPNNIRINTFTFKVDTNYIAPEYGRHNSKIDLYVLFQVLNIRHFKLVGRSTQALDFGRWMINSSDEVFLESIDISGYDYVRYGTNLVEMPRIFSGWLASHRVKFIVDPGFAKRTYSLKSAFEGAIYDGNDGFYDSFLTDYDWSGVKIWDRTFYNCKLFKTITFPEINPAAIPSDELGPWMEDTFTDAFADTFIGIDPELLGTPYEGYTQTIHTNHLYLRETSFSRQNSRYDAPLNIGNVISGDGLILDISPIDNTYVDVRGYVIKAVTMRYSQKESLANIYKGNNQPFQPLQIYLVDDPSVTSTFEEQKTDLETNYSSYGLNKAPVVSKSGVYLFKRTDGAAGVNINTFIFRRTN